MDNKRNGFSLAPGVPGRWPVIERALRIAHAGPIAAVMTFGAVSGAWVLGSVLPFWIGMLALAAIIGARLFSPRVWRAAVEEEATKPADLPADGEISDQAAKALLARIIVARAELDEVLNNGAAPGQGQLRVHVRSVRELERSAVAALRRIEFLASAPTRGERPVAVSAQDDRSPETARLLERAAAARAERIDALGDLKLRRQRELARLEYYTSCLEAIPVALMELQVLEGDTLERGLPDPVLDADALRDEVRHVREGMGNSPI